MNSSSLALIGRVEQRLNSPTFTKEDSSWCDISLKTISLLREAGVESAIPTVSRDEANKFFRGKVGEEVRTREKGVTLRYTALNEGTATAGGDLVPTGFEADVLQAMKRYDQVLEAARWLHTPGGNAMNWPSLDDTGNSGVEIAENGSQTTQTNPVLANVAFGLTPLFSSQIILISRQLLQDAGVDLTPMFAKLFGQRLARVFAPIATAALTSGAATGITSATSGTVTADDLLSLMGALDSAYAVNAGWLMNWATLISVLKMKDSSGKYIFLPLQFDAQGHVLLFGRPVFVCPSLPNIAASAVPIYFGDLSYLLVRQAGPQEYFQYRELYMSAHQVGFEAFARFDAQYSIPGANGSNPVLKLAVHS